MKLNQEKLQEYLNSVRFPRCSLCGDFNWNFNLEPFKLSPINSSTINNDLEDNIVVPITCKHCGNVILINTIAAGILDT